MKETFYFDHDYNARNDEKILELRATFGAEGYGIFWMLVETMAETVDGGINGSLIAGLSLGYGVAKDKLKDILAECIRLRIFFEKDGIIFNNRVLRHKQFRKERSASGKEGAKKRWDNAKKTS